MKRARLLSIAALVALGLGIGAPMTARTASAGEKVYVCHHTSSVTNPVVLIEISANAVDKHLANHGGTGQDTISAYGTLEGCNSVID